MVLRPWLLFAAACLALPAWAQPAPPPRNVVLFVADGLRPGLVNEKNAPAMTRLMADGVRFANSHSLFPTFTTANASALATGHYVQRIAGGDSVALHQAADPDRDQSYFLFTTTRQQLGQGAHVAFVDQAHTAAGAAVPVAPGAGVEVDAQHPPPGFELGLDADPDGAVPIAIDAV